ncbi:MAG: metallophosphoesterase [Bacteroidales bacterium]|nr:metallophosphoesterase [Bacteroidales bacterium]
MNIKRFVFAAFALALASCVGTKNGPEAFDESSVVLSVGVVSDVHINTGVPETSRKWKNALLQLGVKASESDPDGLDGVLVAGDLIDYPSDPSILEFKKVYESVINPEVVPLIYTVGNHDVPNYKWSETMVKDAEYIRKAFGDSYFQVDVDKDAGERLECRHCVLKDYDILTITPDGTSPVAYSPEALKWLDGKLKEITSKNPSRYVIVITHPMLYDTVYGSLLGEADGIWKSFLPGYWATRELPEILSKYPQVVAFGGHLHFPLNDPRSVWQGNYTALGCASVRYMALEAGGYEDMAGQTTMKDKDEFSQGNLVQFDKKGNMRIYRMDFYNKDVIGEPLVMGRPAKNKKHLEAYSFTNRAAANEAPVLSKIDASVLMPSEPWVKKVAKGISVNFASGEDDEFVHHYVVSLAEDGKEISSKKILADFYKHPDPSDMKRSWSVSFSLDDLPEAFTVLDPIGLPVLKPGTYTVSLTAFDSWDAKSEELTTEVTVN